MHEPFCIVMITFEYLFLLTDWFQIVLETLFVVVWVVVL